MFFFLKKVWLTLPKINVVETIVLYRESIWQDSGIGLTMAMHTHAYVLLVTAEINAVLS